MYHFLSFVSICQHIESSLHALFFKIFILNSSNERFDF